MKVETFFLQYWKCYLRKANIPFYSLIMNERLVILLFINKNRGILKINNYLPIRHTSSKTTKTNKLKNIFAICGDYSVLI